jgi:hypothetical protein
MRKHWLVVSFDIYLQAFEHGASAERDGAPVRELLLAHADVHDPEHAFVHVVYRDGEADVYGVPNETSPWHGLMFNHVSGDAFELLVKVADIAELVVMPAGCPVCVVAEHQIDHLPDELRAARVEIVRTGTDLLGVISQS